VTFQACVQEGGSDGYEVCTMYVSDLETFLDPAVQYAQSYCSSCSQSCRRLRTLEEGNNNGGGYSATADCSTCKQQCSSYLKNSGQSGEANLLDCQLQQNYRRRRLDENDNNNGQVQYYTGPGCNNGQVVIGQFYDDECSIKAGNYDGQDGFPLFEALAEIKFDCVNDSSGVCQELIQQSYNCDGNNNGDDSARLCRAGANASRARSYAHKKPWYLRPGRWMSLIFVAGIAVVVLGFLSYTYYVRHRSVRKVPMASLDNQTPTPQQRNAAMADAGIGANAAYTPRSDVPPWAKVN